MMEKQNCREIYGNTLVQMGKENDRIVVLEADLGGSTMSCYFQKEFPQRYFEMGIAEQNMTSFAAGLSLTGKVAFTNSFAVFASGRAYDQIRQSISTANLNVKICGSSSGLSDYGDGATHQAVEDIAIMRAIPNMTVLVPADGVETINAVRAAVEKEGPVYIRINRNDVPKVFSEDIDYEIGMPCVIREGNDITVFACGVMVSKALEAAEELDKERLSIKVVNVGSLKPVDEDAIRELAQGVKGVITAEEHSLIGGLASVITYALRGYGKPIETIGIKDEFGQSGENYDVLLEHYGLTAKNIIDSVKKIINSGGVR